VRGARFVGEIWVEDQDFTIVRINGVYAPAIYFSWKTFEDEYYQHFDSWRTNVKSGLWLPSYVYSQELHRPTLFGNPSYKSSTHLPMGIQAKAGLAGRGIEQTVRRIRKTGKRRSNKAGPLAARSSARVET